VGHPCFFCRAARAGRLPRKDRTGYRKLHQHACLATPLLVFDCFGLRTGPTTADKTTGSLHGGYPPRGLSAADNSRQARFFCAFFFLPGLMVERNFRTFSMSRSVHSRTFTVPSSTTRGGLIVPAAMCRCSVTSVRPGFLAASRVRYSREWELSFSCFHWGKLPVQVFRCGTTLLLFWR
jgi:hypothetical protein